MKATLRITRDDVGEGAAAIDEELPFLIFWFGGVHRSIGTF
jgi:hypothetical protein